MLASGLTLMAAPVARVLPRECVAAGMAGDAPTRVELDPRREESMTPPLLTSSMRQNPTMAVSVGTGGLQAPSKASAKMCALVARSPSANFPCSETRRSPAGACGRHGPANAPG